VFTASAVETHPIWQPSTATTTPTPTATATDCSNYSLKPALNRRELFKISIPFKNNGQHFHFRFILIRVDLTAS